MLHPFLLASLVLSVAPAEVPPASSSFTTVASVSRSPQALAMKAQAATATPQEKNRQAFAQKGVRFLNEGQAGPWFAPLTGEPITYVLPNGQRVTSSGVLSHIGRDSLAERRSDAVALAPWTHLTGLVGSLSVMFSAMAAGTAAGYLATEAYEGALFGMIIGTAGSMIIALPLAYFLPRVSTELSPTEIEVVDAVRDYNIQQAEALGMDVVDIPHAYLGPT